MRHPIKLSTSDKPVALTNNKLNVSFTFGVEKSDRLRGCDDLRRSMTNLACAVETPIKLVRWGHVDAIAHAVNGGCRGWAFFKEDHEAA